MKPSELRESLGLPEVLESKTAVDVALHQCYATMHELLNSIEGDEALTVDQALQIKQQLVDAIHRSSPVYNVAGNFLTQGRRERKVRSILIDTLEKLDVVAGTSTQYKYFMTRIVSLQNRLAHQ